MKKLIGFALVAAVIFGTAQAHDKDNAVYQIMIGDGEGDWLAGKYFDQHSQCKLVAIEAANELKVNLDRFRCVEVDMN